MTPSSSSIATLPLETARLQLRPYAEGDQEALRAVMGDPGIARWLLTELPISREQAAETLAFDIADFLTNGFSRFPVIRLSDGAMVGRAGVRRLEQDGTHYPELGYQIRECDWGQGYATEVSRALRDWWFAAFEEETLYSFIRSDNTASEMVATKNGFEPFHDCLRKGLPHRLWRLDRTTWRRISVRD